MTGILLTGIITLFSGATLSNDSGVGSLVTELPPLISVEISPYRPLPSEDKIAEARKKLEDMDDEDTLSSVGGSQSVTIVGKSEQASKAASYALNACLESLPRGGYYGCKNFVLTLNAENRNRNPKTISPMNRNKTYDHGLCQLNSRYHSKFINSEDFNSIYNQVDYCLDVRKDAKRQSKMPRYAFYERFERGTNVVFNK